jgi:hypothetical protein
MHRGCARKVKFVPMQYTVMMAVRHTANELVQERLYCAQLQSALTLIQILLQVLIQIFEHEGEPFRRMHDIVETVHSTTIAWIGRKESIAQWGEHGLTQRNLSVTVRFGTFTLWDTFSSILVYGRSTKLASDNECPRIMEEKGSTGDTYWVHSIGTRRSS